MADCFAAKGIEIKEKKCYNISEMKGEPAWEYLLCTDEAGEYGG